MEKQEHLLCVFLWLNFKCIVEIKLMFVCRGNRFWMKWQTNKNKPRERRFNTFSGGLLFLCQCV